VYDISFHAYLTYASASTSLPNSSMNASSTSAFLIILTATGLPSYFPLYTTPNAPSPSLSERLIYKLLGTMKKVSQCRAPNIRSYLRLMTRVIFCSMPANKCSRSLSSYSTSGQYTMRHDSCNSLTSTCCSSANAIV
jgi:hypothetical protein